MRTDMNTMEKWNLIVSNVQKKAYAKESEIQQLWENIFADANFFGYSRFSKEIDSQRNITIGSYERTIPDIIIRDSVNNKDLFVVELKQHNLQFDTKYKEQLFSYMRLLRLNIGILVCNKIYLYVLDYADNEISMEIPFAVDSVDGAEFVELFKKDNYEKEKVESFIKTHKEKKQRILQIKQQMQSLTFEQLLVEHFSSNYSEDEIKEAISGIDFSVSTTAKSEVAASTSYTPSRDIGKIFIPTTANEYTEPSFHYIIIKIKESTVLSRGSIYEAVRYAWLATLDKVRCYKYVFAVINGVVKGVFVANTWQYDTHGRPNRVEFIGEDAPKDLSAQFLNKSIPAKYRKPGMASPILFSKN